MIEERTKQLLKVYKKHKKIIVGVDFDDTIFPYNKTDKNIWLCSKTRKILSELKDHITLCLYTVADEQGLKYKIEIMKLYGLSPDYVNASPVEFFKGCRKPYFNILLDDKAGLNETLNTLINFKNKL